MEDVHAEGVRVHVVVLHAKACARSIFVPCRANEQETFLGKTMMFGLRNVLVQDKDECIRERCGRYAHLLSFSTEHAGWLEPNPSGLSL